MKSIANFKLKNYKDVHKTAMPNLVAEYNQSSLVNRNDSKRVS